MSVNDLDNISEKGTDFIRWGGGGIFNFSSKVEQFGTFHPVCSAHLGGFLPLASSIVDVPM